MSVALIKMHTGAVSVVGGDPTEDELKEFVKEHNRRYQAGEPGGPAGHQAELVKEVLLFDDVDDTLDEKNATKTLDISDLL